MIRFSPHAEIRMHVRRITRREVETAIANPDLQMPGHHDRTVIRTRVRGRSLYIVIEPRDRDIVVVSMYAPEEGDQP
jgi:hypothetical protein